MARLWSCGFEMNSLYELTGGGATGTFSYGWTTGRRGGSDLAYYIQADNNTGSSAFGYKDFVVNPTEWYARFAFQSASDIGRYAYMIFYDTGLSNYNVQILFGTTGQPLHYYSRSGDRGNGSGNLIAGWNLLQLHYKHASSGGILYAKLNGVIDINFSGNTSGGDTNGLGRVRWDVQRFGSTFTLDDFAVNDNIGSNENGIPVDAYIDMIKPNAVGDSSDWTPSTGTDNYAAVDEIPPNTTDYVSSSVTGDKDLYELTTITIPSGHNIRLLQPMVVAKRDISTPLLDLSVGIKSDTTEDFDAGHTLEVNYALVEGDNYYLNPDTAASWTQADLNDLQAGMEML